VSLARRLGGASSASPDWRTRAALDLTRVLAHVKEHDPAQHPMRAAGWRRFAGDRKESDAGDDRPRLAEARFRRLLQTGDGEEKVAAFIRLVTFLDGKVKVDQLAQDFLQWNHPEFGDRVRERWAFNYYAAQDAAPPPPPSDDTPLSAEDDDA
jgi:CRISPR type I-E-associated protein CasB/Cse2